MASPNRTRHRTRGGTGVSVATSTKSKKFITFFDGGINWPHIMGSLINSRYMLHTHIT